MTHRVFDYVGAAPETAKALMNAKDVIDNSGLSVPLLHLINLRVSQINGCQFCMDLHDKEARADGETENRLMNLPHWRQSSAFTVAERAVLAWAEALTRTDTDEAERDRLLADLHNHYDDSHIARITFAVAVINALNRLGVAFFRHDKTSAHA